MFYCVISAAKRHPLPPPLKIWSEHTVANGNHPPTDPMTGLYSTQRECILKGESVFWLWGVYLAGKRWMRVNAVVGCGRVRYRFPWCESNLAAGRMTHQLQRKQVNPLYKIIFMCSSSCCCRSAACPSVSLSTVQTSLLIEFSVRRFSQRRGKSSRL